MDKFRSKLKMKLDGVNAELQNINRTQTQLSTKKETLLDVRYDLEQLIESYDEIKKCQEG